MDKTLKRIKEKGDISRYQVTMINYFSIPNQRAFDNVSQEGGRVIKGLAVMGFTDDPQRSLDDAAGDLRMIGCTIFYKRCQEVDTVATQTLVIVSNTIEEEIMKQTLDKELKVIEKKLLLTDKHYKLTRKKSKNWVKYPVVREFPAGIPWKVTEEKKQKLGATNARLAYILHVYQADYKQMKTLLAYAKERKSGTNTGETQHLQLSYQTNVVHKDQRPNKSKWSKFTCSSNSV
jgi:hypothetical protein